MDVKIGDVVEVRKDLEVGVSYGDLCAYINMVESGGHVGGVREVDGNHFKIEGSLYWWSEEMVNFKTIKNQKKMYKVVVKKPKTNGTGTHITKRQYFDDVREAAEAVRVLTEFFKPDSGYIVKLQPVTFEEYSKNHMAY